MAMPQVSEQFATKVEVGVSRFYAGFSAAALVLLSVGTYLVCSLNPGPPSMFWALPGFVATMSIWYVGLAWRRKPLYVIDARGITDNGMFTPGFGLIEWRDIEHVRPFTYKGDFLAIKVSNFDELIARRNILMRPLLWLNGKLSVFLGGELMLSVTLGNVKREILLEQVSRFSSEAGRDVAKPCRSMVREVGAHLSLLLVFALIFLFVGVMAVHGYQQWSSLQSPSLNTLGGARTFPAQTGIGKSQWISDVIVRNSSGNSTGVEIEVSGPAFTSGFLKNPHVMVTYENEKQDKSSPVVKVTREFVPLHEVRTGVWSGVCKTAYLPSHNELLSGVSLLFSEEIGWWTDNLGPKLTASVFADIPKKGRGDICFKVTPLANPAGSASQSQLVLGLNDAFNNFPLYSTTVPKSYPVSLYPDGQIQWLSSTQLDFDSPSKTDAIAAYYKSELAQRGWHSSQRYDRQSGYISVEGVKGRERVEVRIFPCKRHTPVWIVITKDE